VKATIAQQPLGKSAEVSAHLYFRDTP